MADKQPDSLVERLAEADKAKAQAQAELEVFRQSGKVTRSPFLTSGKSGATSQPTGMDKVGKVTNPNAPETGSLKGDSSAAPGKKGATKDRKKVTVSKEDLKEMDAHMRVVEHVRLHKTLSQGKDLDKMQQDLEKEMEARFVPNVDEQATALLDKAQASKDSSQESSLRAKTPPPKEPEKTKKGSSAKEKLQGTYSKVKAAITGALPTKKKELDKNTSKLPDGAQELNISGVVPLQAEPAEQRQAQPEQDSKVLAALKAKDKRDQSRRRAREHMEALYGVVGSKSVKIPSVTLGKIPTIMMD